MKTIQEVQEKSKQLYNWFMDVRKEFPNVKINQNGNNEEFSIYFIGNRIVGDNYETNIWKEVPMIKNEIRSYSENHPTNPKEFWLFLRISFIPYSSSEDYLLPEESFKNKVRKSFLTCIDNFLTKEV